MNLKRFFSTTSREAIKQVRAELGEQAMILSNRKVDGGVEVIASAEGDLAALREQTGCLTLLEMFLKLSVRGPALAGAAG